MKWKGNGRNPQMHYKQMQPWQNPWCWQFIYRSYTNSCTLVGNPSHQPLKQTNVHTQGIDCGQLLLPASWLFTEQLHNTSFYSCTCPLVKQTFGTKVININKVHIIPCNLHVIYELALLKNARLNNIHSVFSPSSSIHCMTVPWTCTS